MWSYGAIIQQNWCLHKKTDMSEHLPSLKHRGKAMLGQSNIYIRKTSSETSPEDALILNLYSLAEGKDIALLFSFVPISFCIMNVICYMSFIIYRISPDYLDVVFSRSYAESHRSRKTANYLIISYHSISYFWILYCTKFIPYSNVANCHTFHLVLYF